MNYLPFSSLAVVWEGGVGWKGGGNRMGVELRGSRGDGEKGREVGEGMRGTNLTYLPPPPPSALKNGLTPPSPPFSSPAGPCKPPPPTPRMYPEGK